MSSFELEIDPREAQYARFAGSVLTTLKEAVARRRDEDVAQAEIAHRAGMDPSALSRILNGRVRNLTIKTISDILWSTDHEPSNFAAEAVEDISSNYCPVQIGVTASDSIGPVAEPVRILGNATRTSAPDTEVQLFVLVSQQQVGSRHFK